MFRHELSPFLQHVLDAVSRLPEGVSVDNRYEPDPGQVGMIAVELDARERDIRQALIGLRAAHCLIETPLEIPGIEPVYRWEVHPQLADERTGNGDRRSHPESMRSRS